MVMFALSTAAALVATAVRNDPVNPFEFVTGRVAGMGRMLNGHFSCVASINGRPSGRGDLSICYLIGTAGGYDIVNRAGAGAQFEAVLAIGVDGAVPPAPPPEMAIAIATSAAQMTIRPDGSVAACTDGPTRIIRRVPGFRDLPPLCESYPPSAERVFTPAPADSGRPRTARLQIGYYLRRP